jgi:hypothetical protein
LTCLKNFRDTVLMVLQRAFSVIPAEAGIQLLKELQKIWTPVFIGVRIC